MGQSHDPQSQYPQSHIPQPPEVPSPAKKSKLANLVLLVSAILVSFGAGEVALRVIGYSNPQFNEADAILGWALRPGVSGWQMQEGEAYVEINFHGQRDMKRSLQKPPDTYRVAVLGDSMTEARQVSFESMYTSLMERDLADCVHLGDRKIEILNFGVAGYGNAQELLLLRSKVWAFEPDLVILAFKSGNDVSDNSRDIRYDSQTPYLVLEDGKLVLNNSIGNTRRFQIKNSWIYRSFLYAMDYSRTLQAINAVLQSLRRKTPVQRQDDPLSNVPTVNDEGLDVEIYLDRMDAKWRAAWENTEAIIRQMSHEVAERGVKFVVMMTDNPIQANPDPEVRKKLENALEVDDLFNPERRIQSFGEQEGIPVWPLAPLMQREAEKRKVYLHGFENTKLGRGHWNEEGHLVVAKTISERVCREVLGSEG